MSNHTSIELFSGAGGMTLGLEKSGFNPVLLNDNDKYACETLRLNRPHWNIQEKDIKDIDFSYLKGKIDLISGGFPCQPFSYAGKLLGLNDLYGSLVFEMIRAIQEVKPKVFLMENVKGLQTICNGKVIEIILNSIEKINYKIIEYDIYNSLYFRVPQKRERLIIIGIRNDLYKKVGIYDKSLFLDNKIYTLQDAFKKGSLYDTDVPYSEGLKYNKWKETIMSHVPEGGNWKNLSKDMQKEYMKDSLKSKGGKTGMAKRLSWNLPSPTLTCSPYQKQTEKCHPKETRPLTVREYARIQTFPDNWIFSGSLSQIYKQIGNAVPVNMSYIIGKRIINMIKDI